MLLFVEFFVGLMMIGKCNGVVVVVSVVGVVSVFVMNCVVGMLCVVSSVFWLDFDIVCVMCCVLGLGSLSVLVIYVVVCV